MSSAQERAAEAHMVEHEHYCKVAPCTCIDILRLQRDVTYAYVREELEGLLGPDEVARLNAVKDGDLRNFQLVERVAQLVALGRAVEAMGQLPVRGDADYRSYAYGHNDCLGRIYRKVLFATERPPDSPTRPETTSEGTPVPPEPSEGDTAPVSGGAG